MAMVQALGCDNYKKSKKKITKLKTEESSQKDSVQSSKLSRNREQLTYFP